MTASSVVGKKLLFVVNTPEFFMSHRLPIALAAKEAGYEVCVATAEGGMACDIRHQGFEHRVIKIARSGQNPVSELGSLIALFRLFRDIKPDLVHLITIKPVLYGGIAARLAGVPAVVSAVSGLGTVFVDGTKTGRARRWLISILYRAAFQVRNLAVIFQNPDDRDTLLATGALSDGQARMIRGSGVDLTQYSYVSEPDGMPVVVMAARLLREKGVNVLVDAARLLKSRGVGVTIRLIGAPDPGNPNSVGASELEEWRSEGIVELLGYRSDIAKQYSAANIVCLPSFYGEGLPKALVEAAACGRAVVTTDHPGCRDAIEPDKSGILVPVKNVEALADAIQVLIENPESRLNMGEAGRRLAEEAFSVNRIVDQHMVIYEELLRNG